MNPMPLRQRLENLPVGQKLLAALLVLMVTVLLVANLTFISAAYYISQESMAPQALQTIGRLVSNPSLASEALASPQSAERLLNELNSYSPLRAAALYDAKGERLAQLQHGDNLELPKHFRHIEDWQVTEFRTNQVITLARPGAAPGHLLLVASSELPVAFYTGTLTASLGILIFSVLLWLIIARQIKRLITRPIHQLEELSRQVTREENYALRASRGNHDEIGSLAEAFNTMLSRSRPGSSNSSGLGTTPRPHTTRPRAWRKKPVIPTANWSSKSRCAARSRKSSPASRTTSTASSTPCRRR